MMGNEKMQNENVGVKYYLMILAWVIELLAKKYPQTRPFIIGINGPQGCGKSTLTKILVEMLEQLNYHAVSVSIDDFYLTRSDQIKLAQQHAENTLLQQRGYPGTHDVPLGKLTLNNLLQIKKMKTVEIPVYDKSKYQGLGDRLPKSDWQEVHYPLDVVFLEGWMLGFTPVREKDLPNPDFYPINRYLNNYQSWYQSLHAFLHLVPYDYQDIIAWRIEAEENVKKLGKPGMSSSQIQAYIEKFIKAYEIYVPQLLENPLTQNNLCVKIGKDRLPLP